MYLCQGKIHNINVVSLGSMLEILKISENNEIKQIEKKKIETKEPILIDNVHLHDNDSKAVIGGPDGRFRYYDLEKGKIVQEYVRSFVTVGHGTERDTKHLSRVQASRDH